MDTQETIHELFEAQATLIPDNIAGICEDQSITYKELNERANQVAHYLQTKGVQLETPVAVCLERSIDLLIIFLGIMKAGGTYIPLDPSHPEARLLFTLNDNDSPILILKSHLSAKFTHYQGTTIVLDHDRDDISKQPIKNLHVAMTSNHLAYIIYTSGSTGKPKGVLIEHKGVVNYCRWFVEYSNSQPQERIDFSSNYIFDMAVTTSIVPLMSGLTIVMCSDEIKKSGRHYLKHLEQNQINIVKMTPSYFKVLLHEAKSHFIDLPYLTTIILGGENLPTVDCESWLAMYPEHTLFNEYGPTEATVAVSQYKICYANVGALGANVPIGETGPDIACYILNEENLLVADGEIGELHIGGVCLARGYLNQPELTQKKFIQNPFVNDTTARLYKTGDLSRRLADGTIEYIGRIDNQVKIRGFRIEPSEIEKNLAGHPAIKDVVVLAQKDERDEKLIAYYIVNDVDIAPDVNQLHHYLEEHLPEYMIPSAFVRINAFPLTANGKLDRQALPVPRYTTNQHYLAPSTALEKTLADIWSEELGLKLIGIEDNFFELGGHSLSAARIISKINSELGKDISLREFYKSSTIKKLIAILPQIKDIEENSDALHSTFFDDYSFLPLSDFQLLIWLANTFEPKAHKLNITGRKRIHGQLNKTALEFAFQAVLKKHEILFFRIFKLRPAQQLQNNLPFHLIEKNITSLSAQQRDAELDASIAELSHFKSWRKDSPMLIARLFLLSGKETELQISMPHIICDDDSPDILFSDLSRFYLLYNDQMTIDSVHADKRYRKHQFNEQHLARESVSRDIRFWEEYLSDACLFTFLPEMVIHNMAAEKRSYSTYAEIPEQGLKNLQQLCASSCVSIHDGLSAVLGLALVNCCPNFISDTQNIFINVIKSTRGSHLYEDTVGCFIRLEPIKISLNSNANLISLSRQVHQSTIETAPYQRCSSLIKLACINNVRQNKHVIRKHLLTMLIYLYTKILPAPNLDRKTLNFTERLISVENENNFMINLNVRKNFIVDIKRNQNKELFGCKIHKIKEPHDDLLEIERVLDVCFIRKDKHNTPYVVISANLQPAFREQLANEMIRIINVETHGKAIRMYLHSLRAQQPAEFAVEENGK